MLHSGYAAASLYLAPPRPYTWTHMVHRAICASVCIDYSATQAYLATKCDAQRVGMLWHDQLSHVSQGELWTDAMLGSRGSLDLQCTSL